MSDYLAAQTTMSFGFDSVLEVVTHDGQKLALASSGAVTLNRPDKIHAARSGGFVDTEFLFDGKTLTLVGKNTNKYTQLEVPGTVDQVIDELRDKYDRPLPAADLLTTNAYDGLMADVYDSKDLGSGVDQRHGVRFPPSGRTRWTCRSGSLKGTSPIPADFP
jgi:hypothetical protein